jgi:hypothetical protein
MKAAVVYVGMTRTSRLGYARSASVLKDRLTLQSGGDHTG